MNKPALSVLIDTFNHERFIEQALVSVLEQDFPASDMEIVVVDDGSTDRTSKIVSKFAPRVRLLQKKNGGQASAFNAAIPELRGEIISFLDGDDWFAPSKLKTVMNALEKHPETAAVGHGFYEVHELTNETLIRVPQEEELFHLATTQAAHRARIGWVYQPMGALTARKKAVQSALPIPEALTFCADGPLRFACLAAGMYVLKTPLFYYRHHSDNLYSVENKTADYALKIRRRQEMHERMFQAIEPVLLRLGVPPESVTTALYRDWIGMSRFNLRTYGGSRLKVLRTEMRCFRLEFKTPSMRYRLFKYIVVGTMILLLPAHSFYRVKEWYGERNLRRFRERLFKST